jgi:hypothetical protein
MSPHSRSDNHYMTLKQHYPNPTPRASYSNAYNLPNKGNGNSSFLITSPMSLLRIGPPCPPPPLTSPYLVSWSSSASRFMEDASKRLLNYLPPSKPHHLDRKPPKTCVYCSSHTTTRPTPPFNPNTLATPSNSTRLPLSPNEYYTRGCTACVQLPNPAPARCATHTSNHASTLHSAPEHY